MKIKTLTLAIFLLNILLFSGIAISQQKEYKQDKVKKTPEEFAKKKADRMKEKLSLSETQYKEIYDLFLNKAIERKTNREKYKGMDKENRKELKKQNRSKFKQQLDGLLSKEQIEKLDKMKAERKNKKGKKHKKYKEKSEN